MRFTSWARRVSLNRPFYYELNPSPPANSLPFPREIGLPPSAAADAIRSTFLELDLTEHFLGIKNAYMRESAFWDDSDCYQIEHRLAVLFQRFLAIEVKDFVRIYIWNQPDVEEELRAVMAANRCENVSKRENGETVPSIPEGQFYRSQ